MPTPLGLLPLHHILETQFIKEMKQPDAPKKGIINAKIITNKELHELRKSGRDASAAIQAEHIVLR